MNADALEVSAAVRAGELLSQNLYRGLRRQPADQLEEALRDS